MIFTVSDSENKAYSRIEFDEIDLNLMNFSEEEISSVDSFMRELVGNENYSFFLLRVQRLLSAAFEAATRFLEKNKYSATAPHIIVGIDYDKMEDSFKKFFFEDHPELNKLEGRDLRAWFETKSLVIPTPKVLENIGMPIIKMASEDGNAG